MPRKMKPRDIQRSRGNNYVFHFEMRQWAQSLRDERAAAFIASLPEGHLNLFGQVNEVWPWPVEYSAEGDILCRAWISASNRLGFDGGDWERVNPWYWSVAGWERFQVAWQGLPEPINAPIVVHRGLCTSCVQLEVVHRADRFSGKKSGLYTKEP